MKKIILIGKTGCGKTTLTQALKGEAIHYHKTQYIKRESLIIDTPGEYAETKTLSSGLAQYVYEADVVGLLMDSSETYSLYPPNLVSVLNREVIGIVTKIDQENTNPDQAKRWLELAGCKKIIQISALTGEGMDLLMESLN